MNKSAHIECRGRTSRKRRVGTLLFWVGAAGFFAGLTLGAIPATSFFGLPIAFLAFLMLVAGLGLRSTGRSATSDFGAGAGKDPC